MEEVLVTPQDQLLIPNDEAQNPGPTARSNDEDVKNETDAALENTGNEEMGEDDTDERGYWSNQMEFLCSCISMSVGLGNVWRFPVQAYKNGGGAFLIPYFIILLVIGRPIYFLELCLGQFTSHTQIDVWKCCPILKGVGYTSMFATFCVISYYTSVMAIILFYLAVSFTSPLLWTKCAPEDDQCGSMNGTTAAESYFLFSVLRQRKSIDDGIGAPIWTLSLGLFVSWFLIFCVVFKGIKSSGKVAYFTASFPYVLLFVLLIHGLALDGAWDGIYAFVKPEWNRLYTAKVWYAAASQCFFSLNTGFGSVIMFGSYNRINHNIYRDATFLSLLDTFTSFVAGATVFSVMGFLAKSTGKEISDLIGDGEAGIAFIAYPTAIAEFKAPQLFGVLFFIMLYTLALGSSSADAGTLISLIADRFPKSRRWLITMGFCLPTFLVGLVYVTPGGQFILNLVDHFGVSFVIFISSFVEVIGIIWIYGMSNFMTDIEFMLNRKLGWYWKACWKFITPIGLLGILVWSMVEFFHNPLTFNEIPYPVPAIIAGWVLGILCLSPLVVCAVLEVIMRSRHGDYREFYNVLKATMSPEQEWGPKNQKIRKKWENFKSTI